MLLIFYAWSTTEAANFLREKGGTIALSIELDVLINWVLSNYSMLRF